MTVAAALGALIVVVFGLWMIVGGDRTLTGKSASVNFLDVARRERRRRFGYAFADATIVLTAMSFNIPLSVVPVGLFQSPFAGRLAVGIGLLIALAFLPALVRPLLALLAGLGVILNSGGGSAVFLAAVYLGTALFLALVKRAD